MLTGSNDIMNLCLPLISGTLIDILIQLTKRNEKMDQEQRDEK